MDGAATIMQQMASDFEQMSNNVSGLDAKEQNKALEGMTEVINNTIGVEAGRMMSDFIQGKASNAQQLRENLTALLCK